MAKKVPFTFEEFKSIYSRVPRLCVELVIKTESGIVLLLRKKFGWEGMWHMPGSTVYYQEPVEACVKRTAEEEAGVYVEIDSFLGYQDYPEEAKVRGFGHSVSLVFLCHVTSGTLVHDEDAGDIATFQELPETMVKENKEFLESHWKQIF